MNAYKQPIAIALMLGFTLAALAFYQSNIPVQSKPSDTLAPLIETRQTETPSLTRDVRDVILDPQKENEQAPVIRSPKASMALAPEESNETVNTSPSSQHDVLPIKDPTAGSATLPSEIVKLDERFQMEKYDVQWAAKIESETWDEFYSANLASSEIEAVDCRTSICKITITHDSENAEQQFRNTLVDTLNGRKGKIHSRIDEHGLRVTTVYRYR